MPAEQPLSTLADDRLMIAAWVARSLPDETAEQRRHSLLAEALRLVQQAIDKEPALAAPSDGEAPPAP